MAYPTTSASIVAFINLMNNAREQAIQALRVLFKGFSLFVPPSFLLLFSLSSSFSPFLSLSNTRSYVLNTYVYIYTAETYQAQFHRNNQCRLFLLRMPLRVRRASSRRDISLGMLCALGFSRWSSRSHADRFLQLENRVLTCNVISYVPSAPLLSETRRALTIGVFWCRSLQFPSAVEMCLYLLNRHLFVIRDWKHGKYIREREMIFFLECANQRKRNLFKPRKFFTIVTINYSKIKSARTLSLILCRGMIIQFSYSSALMSQKLGV